jgi:hypothetical protein
MFWYVCLCIDGCNCHVSLKGVDATAARSCFLMLVQLMRTSNVTVVFTNLSSEIEGLTQPAFNTTIQTLIAKCYIHSSSTFNFVGLMRAHKVIVDDDIVIPQLDDALEWCEEQILYRAQKLLVPEGYPENDAQSPRGRGSNDRLQSDGRESPAKSGLAIRATLQRDPAYYAKAWKQRYQLSKASSSSSKESSTRGAHSIR